MRAPFPSQPLCDPPKPTGAYLAVVFLKSAERRESALVCVPGTDPSAWANTSQTRDRKGPEARCEGQENRSSGAGATIVRGLLDATNKNARGAFVMAAYFPNYYFEAASLALPKTDE